MIRLCFLCISFLLPFLLALLSFYGAVGGDRFATSTCYAYVCDSWYVRTNLIVFFFYARTHTLGYYYNCCFRDNVSVMPMGELVRVAVRAPAFAIYDNNYKILRTSFSPAWLSRYRVRLVFSAKKKNCVLILIGRDRFWVAAVNEHVD